MTSHDGRPRGPAPHSVLQRVAGLIARDMAALHRKKLPATSQETLSHRTRVFLEKRAAVHPARLDQETPPTSREHPL